MSTFNVSHEALEIFNMNEFTLNDVSLFCIPALKKYNVYQFTFGLNGSDPDTSLTTLLHLVGKLCGMYIIQECSDSHARVTFVTTCLYNYFMKRVERFVSYVNRRYPTSSVVVL